MTRPTLVYSVLALHSLPPPHQSRSTAKLLLLLLSDLELLLARLARLELIAPLHRAEGVIVLAQLLADGGGRETVGHRLRQVTLDRLKVVAHRRRLGDVTPDKARANTHKESVWEKHMERVRAREREVSTQRRRRSLRRESSRERFSLLVLRLLLLEPAVRGKLLLDVLKRRLLALCSSDGEQRQLSVAAPPEVLPPA